MWITPPIAAPNHAIELNHPTGKHYASYYTHVDYRHDRRFVDLHLICRLTAPEWPMRRVFPASECPVFAWEDLWGQPSG
jgi:hypothetical protein